MPLSTICTRYFTVILHYILYRALLMDFVMEMCWLLQINERRSIFGNSNPSTEPFPLNRFKWLIEFSMDHDWCAVFELLLDIMLNGTVSLGEHSSLTITLAELGLLHRAVRRNCKPLVSLRLRYVPERVKVQEHDESSGELFQICTYTMLQWLVNPMLLLLFLLFMHLHPINFHC